MRNGADRHIAIQFDRWTIVSPTKVASNISDQWCQVKLIAIFLTFTFGIQVDDCLQIGSLGIRIQGRQWTQWWSILKLLQPVKSAFVP